VILIGRLPNQPRGSNAPTFGENMRDQIEMVLQIAIRGVSAYTNGTILRNCTLVDGPMSMAYDLPAPLRRGFFSPAFWQAWIPVPRFAVRQLQCA
jgi:hypothetical protein